MAKPKKNKFRLSVKTADGLSVQSSGECGTAGEAFALYMLPIDPKNVPTEGAAGEFYAARAAYLTAAAKCYEEIQAKQSSGEATR